MVTFTTNIPHMLAYIPYMDPMGIETLMLGSYFFKLKLDAYICKTRHSILIIYIYIDVELFLAAGTSSTHGPKRIFAAQAQPNLAAWETAVERQTSNSRLEFGGETAAWRKHVDGDGSLRPSLLQKPSKTNEHPNIAGSCGSSGSSSHPNMGIIRCWSAIRMARLGPGFCLFFFGPATWSNVSHVSSEEAMKMYEGGTGELWCVCIYIYIVIYIYINDMIWYGMIWYDMIWCDIYIYIRYVYAYMIWIPMTSVWQCMGHQE